MEPTQEMIDWYETRTRTHIGLVQEVSIQIGKYFPRFEHRLLNIVSRHDQSKFHEPELTPYIFLSWFYHVDGYEYPEGVEALTKEATLHHIKHNKHHPDYWDPDFSPDNVNSKDRDAPPDKLVNGTLMPDIYIAEMCADWAAMGKEKGNSPIEWADKNVNVRWEFHPRQVDLIYVILEAIE
jgi:hypothetical protein